MSHEYRLQALRQKFTALSQEVEALKDLRKIAFVPAPPMPQGPPPMDPSMMQGGMPMDPAAMQGGMPMDPSMMQAGAPPMDPAMMQGGMPMDPAAMQAGAPPTDPAMMQGGGQPPAPEATPQIDPALIDQIVGLLEEMGQKMQQQTELFENFQNTVAGELQELSEQTADLEKRLVETEAGSADAKTRTGASW